MNCQSCGSANPEGTNFCGECGTALAADVTCASCGSANASGSKFCRECGARFDSSAAPQLSSVAASAIADGERRQLTVMFADLADSTALSGRLDPEDYRDAVRRYHTVCAEAIERFGGYVGKWLGDGVLAYFGYPSSQEDDAQRAIRAGLEIVAWARDHTDPADQAVEVRVGLHTGLTVIGEMGSGERVEHADVAGETPNIAARVQSDAPPNTVVISASTERLVHGYFLMESLGEQRLKGVTRPIEVFRILGESGAASRLDVAERLTPFVGREQETALLLDRWQKAADGEAQVVVLSGEPGIGKSRLARMLHEQLPGGHLLIPLQCSQSHQNSALYPLIEHFQRILNQEDPTSPRRSNDPPAERLAAMLGDAGVETTTTLPLFAALLGLPLPNGYSPLDLTPEQQKQKTLEATLAWLDAEAVRRPVLLACEDLHWIDPSTLDLIGMVVEREGGGNMLVLLSCRPEFMPPWPPQSHVAVVQLARLGREDAHKVMTRVARGRVLPSEVADQIVARTDGVPLFVEELTKMVLESGLLREEDGRLVLNGPLPTLAIPDTLQDSLMARLDRLGSAKEVAQLGATIGREFSGELIAAVSPLPPGALVTSLDALVASGLAYRRGFATGARYVFKHALIQDAAYQTLLKSTRGRYHQRIAEALVAQFPDIAESQPELVAHHYTEAGLHDPAAAYWRQAGERALARSANPEAISHLKTCLEALGEFPESEARDRQELAAQIALGSAYRASQGYSSRDAAAAYGQARELGYKLEAWAELVPILWGLWGGTFMTGQVTSSMALAEECLTLAERQPDPGYTVQGYRILSATSCWLGDFEGARQYAAEGVKLYETDRDAAKVAQFQVDGFSSCKMYSSWATWMLGFPEGAMRLADDALRHARSLKHLHTLPVALIFTAITRLFLRESERPRSEGEEATRIALEHGFTQWSPMGEVVSGAALAALGGCESGVARLNKGITGWRSLDSKAAVHLFIGLKADALLACHRLEEARLAANEGLKLGSETGERFYEAELYRLRGEAVLPDDQAAAERDFLRALEVSRQLSAKSLELRAAMSLARFWRDRGKQDEARKLLADVYGWFSEGFETGDLQAAKALVNEFGQ